MDVVSLCPLRVGSLVWQPRRGTWVLTAVCKATYSLTPAESPLDQEQEYPNEDDNHWNDDPARSLYSPADLVPFKPRADVMLVGHAFAARKDPARSLVARLIVGDVNKAIEVWCDRSWTQDGSLREGPRFLKMPLRYERAAGGPETTNPVGVRLDARPDAYGSVPVPNLQPTGFALATPKDFIEPICFGPVAWTWPARRDRLARHASAWSPSTWSQQPIPEDIDPTFFNAAPRDQQLDALRPNERIILENLHPEHARLATNLVGKTPRAFVERRGATAQEVQLICDTLWIDTDRSICSLTWRAQIPLEHPGQPGRVFIALAEPGQRLTWAAVERLAASVKPEDDEPATTAPGRGVVDPTAPPVYAEPPRGPRKMPTLPFMQSSPDFTAAPPEVPKPRPSRPRGDPLVQTHDEITAAAPAPPGAALPFGSAPPPPPPPRRTLAETASGAGAPPWLTQSRASAPSGPPAGPPGSPFKGNAPAPPPMYAPQALQAHTVPAFSSAPYEAGSSNSDALRALAAPRVVEMPGLVQPAPAASPPGLAVPSLSAPGLAVPSLVQPLAGAGGAPQNLGPIAPPAPVQPAAPAMVSTAAAASVGVVAVSNAAAANARVAAAAAAQQQAPVAPAAPAAPAPRAAGVRPREVVDLLWFDPAVLPRLRGHQAWKNLLEALREKPRAKDEKKASLGFDDDEEDEADKAAAPPPEPPELKDRRDVCAVLARGEPIEPDWVSDAITDAVGEDGSFMPPLVLTGGELTFPFDELATLKATVTAVKPFVGGDKKLKETVDSANELLAGDALESSTGVAEGLTGRIREAFQQQSRMVPASYVDTQTERMLLEQRQYQKRTVFGAPWLRAVLAPATGGGNGVPVYLPEELSKQLPMFQRFRARVIAEAHLQQDQYETNPAALKVVAVARVMPLGIGVGAGRERR